MLRRQVLAIVLFLTVISVCVGFSQCQVADRVLSDQELKAIRGSQSGPGSHTVGFIQFACNTSFLCAAKFPNCEGGCSYCSDVSNTEVCYGGGQYKTCTDGTIDGGCGFKWEGEFTCVKHPLEQRCYCSGNGVQGDPCPQGDITQSGCG